MPGASVNPNLTGRPAGNTGLDYPDRPRVHEPSRLTENAAHAKHGRQLDNHSRQIVREVGTMDLQLRNRVVLIMGRAKGIGAAITRACAEEGAIPIVLDRNKAAGEQLHAQLAATGVPSQFLEVDLTRSETCQHAVQRSAAIYQRLDALVNNAGINDKVGLASGGPTRSSLLSSAICFITTTWLTMHCRT